MIFTLFEAAWSRVYRRKGELYNRLDERGHLFGKWDYTNNKVRFPVKATEDTPALLYPWPIFQELCDNYDSFADFVEVEDNARLRRANLDSLTT